ALALSLAIVGIDAAIKYVSANWDTIVTTMTRTFNQVVDAAKQFGVEIALVAVTIGVFTSVTVDKAVYALPQLTAQIIVSTAQFIIFAAAGIGNAIIAMVEFTTRALIMASIWAAVTLEVV